MISEFYILHTNPTQPLKLEGNSVQLYVYSFTVHSSPELMINRLKIESPVRQIPEYIHFHTEFKMHFEGLENRTRSSRTVNFCIVYRHTVHAPSDFSHTVSGYGPSVQL